MKQDAVVLVECNLHSPRWNELCPPVNRVSKILQNVCNRPVYLGGVDIVSSGFSHCNCSTRSRARTRAMPTRFTALMDPPARQTISYDDITTPATWRPRSYPKDDDRDENGGPAKRGRWSRRGGGTNNAHRQTHPHWDEPGEQQPIMSYDSVSPAPSAAPSIVTTNYLDSNDMSHIQSSAPTSVATIKSKKRSNRKAKNKIPKTISLADTGLWDDSVLTDAWDAANEEYEVGV